MNLGSSQPKRPIGCRTKIFWKSFQLRSNAGRYRFIALLCTSNWFFGPKREKTGLVHFPLGFRGKNFKNFRKFFRPKITSKDTLGIGSSRTKTTDRYMHPSGTQGGLEKNLPKFRNNPQMGKMCDCAWWVHILGVGRGPNKVPYHTSTPYKYWLLTVRQ